MHDETREIWRLCGDEECDLCDRRVALESYYEDIAVEESRGIY